MINAAPVRLQRENVAALQLINETLTELIAESKALFEKEDLEFQADADFLSTVDPSILHFLIAAGDEVRILSFVVGFASVLSTVDPSILHFLIAAGDEVRSS